MNLFDMDKTVSEIQPDIYLLRNFANFDPIKHALKIILKQAPPRHMHTPGGRRINAAMTACGSVGWVSDHNGYRYSRLNPQTQQAWPSMPETFQQLAQQAAQLCDFEAFQPDSCLINVYQNEQGMGCHRDENEQDMNQPVVSVSLGMTATFQIYGVSKSHKPLALDLFHGDVMVWGRGARLMYHAIKPIRSNPHSVLGYKRYNLTFRKAL
ncbi:alpha-ketoglutarate-dependent dioxygenase AlkB [Marinicella sp. W31]|uniref:alpha-ketoglutarate-dependent dioxygenase AlkB n=1 Tax=Marinicella sp. W31 TaxID=3023713 RepID=UPI0037564325